VAAAGLVLLALVLGLAAAVAGFVQATRARNELAMKEEAAVRQAARANLAAAAALIQAHKVAQARDLLQRVPPERRGWEWNHAVWLADTSLRTLAPGEGGVLQVACLADGASIAVNLWDRSASVLDLEGRKPRRPLAGTRHSGEFFAASPDGRSLLVHGEGGIELRELASDRELWRRPGRASLHPRAFHPSGEVLVAGVAAESRAWIIDAATGREVRSFPLALSAEIPGFSPSGERIVYKSWVGYTAVEAQTGEAVWEHQARGFAWDAATLPAGGWLVAVVADDMLRVLDGDTGKLLYQRSGASSDITTVALSPRGDRLATAEFSGAVGLWEPASGELLAVLHGHAGNCSSLDFTGDGRRLVTGAHSEIKVWDAATSVSESLAARVRGQLQHHRIFNAALSPDGKRAATLGWGNISLWDAETGAELWTRVGSREYYFCGAFSRDGRRLAAADAARALTVLDVERGEPPPWTLRLPPILLVLAWTPRGELLAAGDDGAVRAIDPAAGQVIRELTRHGNPVQALAVSPDGTRIASGSGDPQLLSSGYLPPPGNGETSIRLLDGEGRELRTLRAHGAAVQCLAFSGDGTLFASGDARGRLVLWDAASGDLRAELSAAGTELRSLAFSPDGLRLAAVRSVVEDASIHLWDTRNADEAAVLRVAGNTGAALGFSASGSALLAAGQGATVIASFETGPPACGFEARERVRRARALIDRLFDEEVLSAGVVARLEADDDLDPALRATAVSLALARGDQLNYLNSEAWGTVRQAGRPPAELAEALRKAELVARLRPDDYGFLNTLGVAQYRAGRLEEAVATLRRCEEMYRERRGTAHPIDVAVLAMARRRLGKDEEARADLERMRALLGAPEHAADVETAVIAREAERLVAGGAEAEAGSEAESDSESESDAESDADADPESDPGSGSGSGSGTGTGTGKKK
jgi:WD40 repeat protein